MAKMGSMLNLSPLGLVTALGTSAILTAGANHAFNLAEKRFLALRSPSWELQGQAKKYGNLADTARYVKGQETLLNGMFDLPYEMAKQTATKLPEAIMSSYTKGLNKREMAENFQTILNDPSVQSLGEEKAKSIYEEIGSVVPNTLRKAPSVAIPAIQNSLMTGSQALRPDYLASLAKVEDVYNRKK